MKENNENLTKTPVVTILIPFYNGASTILETLISVKNQTYESFHCRVLDDGSDVDQAMQLNKLVKSLEDSRFSVVTGPNVGLCENINRSLTSIFTPFIARIDQDDICLPHRLQRQVAVATEGNSDCCFSGIIKFGKKNQTKYRKVADSYVVPYRPEVHGGMVHSTMLIRSDAIKLLGGYDASYYPSDDWDLTLRMVDANLKIDYIDEALIKYRFHDSANTYRFYSMMCDSRRRSEAKYPQIFDVSRGKEEKPRFDRFIDYATLRRYLKDNSKLCFRRAGGCYLDGFMLSAARWAFLSFMWHPQSYLKRVTSFLKTGK